MYKHIRNITMPNHVFHVPVCQAVEWYARKENGKGYLIETPLTCNLFSLVLTLSTTVYLCLGLFFSLISYFFYFCNIFLSNPSQKCQILLKYSLQVQIFYRTENSPTPQKKNSKALNNDLLKKIEKLLQGKISRAIKNLKI